MMINLLYAGLVGNKSEYAARREENRAEKCGSREVLGKLPAANLLWAENSRSTIDGGRSDVVLSQQVIKNWRRHQALV